MNRYASVLVFLVLVTTSLVGSIWNYNSAKRAVVNDLNTALQQAIAANRDLWLKPDTIANYRRMQGAVATPLCVNMRDERASRCMSESLRGNTFVELRLADNNVSWGGGQQTADEQHLNSGQSAASRGGGLHAADEQPLADGLLCSDTIFLTDDVLGARLAVRSVANCSAAQIFALSDQRVPAVLCLLSITWAVLMLRRRKQALAVTASRFPILVSKQLQEDALTPDVSTQSIGGLVHRDGAFFDKDEQEIHLTPMQRELLTMFLDAPAHKLLQTDITRRLWPKKDDASETLYALITRTKKAVEHRCGVKIEVDRGRGYSLTFNKANAKSEPLVL